jgi:HD-GYP domain-containing protein (c-di-GMP phosphodiesterase class II)
MPISVFEIRVHDLKYGMYVSSLDRPWLDTPFPIQGFIVKSELDKERLSKYCEYVYIDVQKSNIKSIPKHIIDLNNNPNATRDSIQIYKLTHLDRILYQKTTSREEELLSAKENHKIVEDTYQKLLHDVENDITFDLPAVKKAIKPMVRSIVRNPDSYIWLTYLKSINSYTYHHAISCSVWAVAFGRHLGLPAHMLNSLAIGCFLFDIGKSKLPKTMLNSSKKLTSEEFETVKDHVSYGVEIVKKHKGVGKDILDMIKTHHERHNGSGYPMQLKDGSIPLYGRIAGLVDVYDAITSPRPFCDPIPTYEAIASIYEWRGVEFQTELIEQFIQVVGIYPVGSLVELNNKTVGVVIAQSEYFRLRPQIMVLLDEKKKLLKEFYIVDLKNETNEEGEEDKNTEGLTISRGLPPGAYNLDHSKYYF